MCGATSASLYGGASGANEGLLGSGRGLSSMGSGPGQGMKVATLRPKTSAGVVGAHAAQLYNTITMGVVSQVEIG